MSLPAFVCSLSAPCESVSDLVELKGLKSFPYNSDNLGRFDHAFSQLIHQTALSLISYKWHTELLIALATMDHWYIFRIIDASDDRCVKFTIYNSWSCGVTIPYFAPVVDEMKCYMYFVQCAGHNLEHLISFLATYLSAQCVK